MCASVEMLSRFSAEKFFSESFSARMRRKNAPMHNCRNFSMGRVPISIGGTLHLHASPLRFISL